MGPVRLIVSQPTSPLLSLVRLSSAWRRFDARLLLAARRPRHPHAPAPAANPPRVAIFDRFLEPIAKGIAKIIYRRCHNFLASP